jgi:hypothetical protein
VLLWGDMINAGTYVRLLRHLGVALIFAPEPFTTPFGVALILVARHLSKQVEVNRNNRLRETVRYYLAHTSHFGDYVDGESGAPGPAKRHDLSQDRDILGQITGSRSLEANSPVRSGRRDIQPSRVNHAADTQSLSPRYKPVSSHPDTSTGTQKVIHHTINMEWLSQGFESANSAVAHSSWATTSVAMEGMIHHSVNMNLPSQHHKTGNIEQGKAKPHAIDIAQLRQRYGSAVNCTTALRAVQNNNCYYDILSRRNVIGGY